MPSRNPTVTQPIEIRNGRRAGFLNVAGQWASGFVTHPLRRGRPTGKFINVDVHRCTFGRGPEFGFSPNSKIN